MNEKFVDNLKKLFGEDYWIANIETNNEELNKDAEYFANCGYSREGFKRDEYIIAVAKYCFIAGANYQKMKIIEIIEK